MLRVQLAKCGKLDMLKTKLSQMNKSLNNVRSKDSDQIRQAADADKDAVDPEPAISSM